ncbi:MAG: restriction endonuclease subunit S [Ignavibacteriales bacterium]|nr:restriction endonuclease subunit S [Ignavibacteriales bacterium]
MNKYPKYKPSKVKWIGDIPDHWYLKKIKYVGKTLAGGTPSTTNPEYWDGDIPWLNSGKVQNNIILPDDVDKYITQLGLEQSATKMIKENSVLVALTGATCANIGFLTFPSTANQSVVAIENETKLISKFLFYFLLSQREQILIERSGGAQSGINEGDVKNLILSLPQLKEQETIANFLDEKTSQIDKLISNKQKLIDLLKEERTAIINQAVTKGINPNVKLKPSGIDWLGDIPEHWEVKNLKFVARVQSSNVDKKTNEDEIPVLLCNYIDVYKNEFIDDSFNFMEATASKKEIEKFILKQDDVLITKDSETPDDIANPAYVTQNFDNVICGYHLAQIRTNRDKIIGGFLFRLFQSKKFNSHFEVSANGVTRFGLPLDSITDVKVSYPSVVEQLQIFQHIETETKRIDITISKIEKEIELFQEYRTSLISEVVTGKIKV